MSLAFIPAGSGARRGASTETAPATSSTREHTEIMGSAAA